MKYFCMPKLETPQLPLQYLSAVSNDIVSIYNFTFRRDHWDRIIRLYFDEFSKNLKDFVGNDAKLPTYDEFLIDVRASIPISIFFCANFRDLDQSESFSSMDSDMDPVFGNEGLQKESIQNLRGSFHKLQNSYSVYFLHDSSQTIREGNFYSHELFTTCFHKKRIPNF